MSRNLIAILRGLELARAVETAKALITAGIVRIEVPLNGPDALICISALQGGVGKKAEIGAGTVLSEKHVRDAAAAGARFVVSPNCEPGVIALTKSYGLASYPGVFTPTECFAALEAGADGLKIFPANLMGTDGLKAMRAVLPKETAVYAVGGIGPDDFSAWREAGASGFGLGSSLFKPDWPLDRIAAEAAASIAAYDAAYGADA